jgi:hypothetical protein
LKLWEACRPLLLPALDGADEQELLADLAAGGKTFGELELIRHQR